MWGAARDSPTNTRIMPIDTLPDELLAACFAAMSARSLARAALVCVRWRGLASRDEIWRPLCLARWPSTARLNVANYKKFFMQRKKLTKKLQPQKMDYTLLLDGTLNGSKFSVSLPLAAAAADGGELTWACAQLAWQPGTVPDIDVKDAVLWRESTQQLAKLDGQRLGGTADIKEQQRGEEDWEGWRDGSIKPFHVWSADFDIDEFVNGPPEDNLARFGWRVRYMNSSVVFSLVGCLFRERDTPWVWELNHPNIHEDELEEIIEEKNLLVLLRGLTLAFA